MTTVERIRKIWKLRHSYKYSKTSVAYNTDYYLPIKILLQRLRLIKQGVPEIVVECLSVQSLYFIKYYQDFPFKVGDIVYSTVGGYGGGPGVQVRITKIEEDFVHVERVHDDGRKYVGKNKKNFCNGFAYKGDYRAIQWGQNHFFTEN